MAKISYYRKFVQRPDILFAYKSHPKQERKQCQNDEFEILTFKLPLTINYQNFISRKNRHNVAQKLFGLKKNAVLQKRIILELSSNHLLHFCHG